jgi:NAD(P)-dependent dehydrogenase (short-subunit alcohol dehydrogenase family)
VRGSWLVSRAVAKRWRAIAKSDGGSVYGRIVNTTSGAGLLGHFGQSNYGPAKAAIVGLTQTLSLELGSIGVTVNAISPGGVTRLSGTISGAESVPEPDERPEGEFDPKDPSHASPVVAWLASEQAGYITGQVFRAIGEDISLMEGWTRKVTVSNGGTRWDAAKLGQVMATDIFGSRAPGLRLGS